MYDKISWSTYYKVINATTIPKKLKSGLENININFGFAGDKDAFQIKHKDGAAVSGYYQNQDFPGEKTKSDRGEVFLVQVNKGNRFKGIGYNLTEDAINIISANGGKTVNLSATSEGGRAIIKKLIANNIISGPIKTSETGKAEYNIISGWSAKI